MLLPDGDGVNCSDLNRIAKSDSGDLERMRREMLIGFYVRAGEAAALIEDANATKRESDQKLPDMFCNSFGDE